MNHVTDWINPNIAAIRPYQPGRPIEEVARELGLDPDDISKLASNENPLGASPKALRSMRHALAESFLYPDGSGHILRSKLADEYGVDLEQIILGAGSNEILELIGHCFMGPGKSIVISEYTFIVYKLTAQMFGAEVIEVPAKGLEHDLTRMRRAITDDTSVIFICNPNNPTGSLIRQPAMRRFMEQVPEHVLVVFDEAYAEIALSRMPDTLSYVKERPNCIMLRTFSKAYGLAGLRIGYGIGSASVVGALQKARQPFNSNRLAQIGAAAALDDKGFVRRSRRLFRQGRDYIQESCQAMGLKCEPAFANFMLIKVGKGAEVTAKLMERGVIVRPMDGYQLPEYIRISFGTMEQNQKFISALKDILGK
jgi:histidinol-phosphate aminotransferase